MKDLSSFTHPRVFPNLNEFIFFTYEDILNVDNQATLNPFDFYWGKTKRHFSKYLILCHTEERLAYRFMTTSEGE